MTRAEAQRRAQAVEDEASRRILGVIERALRSGEIRDYPAGVTPYLGSNPEYWAITSATQEALELIAGQIEETAH